MKSILLLKCLNAARYASRIFTRAISWLTLSVISPLARHAYFWLANATRRKIRKSRFRWRQTTRPYRFYVVGSLIVLTWLFSVVLLHDIEALFPLLLLGAVMYLMGFFVWSKPLVKKILMSWWGKMAFTISNGFLLILAIVTARSIVLEALQLPPQYFDLTISFIALITYVPVCIAALAVLVIVFYVAMLVLATLTNFLPNLLVAICRPVVGNKRWLNKLNAKYGMISTKAFYHAVGAAVVGFMLAFSLDGFGLLVRQMLPTVRWLAYITDFQPAGRYPGVPCDGRIKLQDNGVVAVARIKDRDIEISIQNFDSNVVGNCLSRKDNH